MADRSFLAWPFFEDSHRALAEAIQTWCDRDFADAEIDLACQALVEDLAKARWLEVAAPPSDKFDVRALCLIRETLAYHSGLADFAFAMQGLGSAPIILFGSDDQRSRYLPAVRNGRSIAAFALTEPNSGSDVAAIATTATRCEGGWVLNGEKAFISNAGLADFTIVFARTGDAPGAKGLSAFIVEAGADGFQVGERVETSAPHPLGSIRLQNCHVSDSSLVGETGFGFKIAMSTLDVFRSTVGAAALGFARRALDESLARTTSRTLFGTRLSEMQVTQAKLAEMAMSIDASALLIYRAAWAKDSGAERVTREAAMAKYFATEQAQDVIDKAVQLHGAAGVAVGSAVEHLYREIRPLRIYEGASEVQLQIIAKQLLSGEGAS